MYWRQKNKFNSKMSPKSNLIKFLFFLENQIQFENRTRTISGASRNLHTL